MEHLVEKIKIVQTKFGPSIVIDLLLEEGKVSSFIPERYYKSFKADPERFEYYREQSKKKQLFVKLDGVGKWKNVNFIVKN